MTIHHILLVLERDLNVAKVNGTSGVMCLQGDRASTQFDGSLDIVRFDVVDDHFVIDFHDNPFAFDDNVLSPPLIILGGCF